MVGSSGCTSHRSLGNRDDQCKDSGLTDLYSDSVLEFTDTFYVEDYYATGFSSYSTCFQLIRFPALIFASNCGIQSCYEHAIFSHYNFNTQLLDSLYPDRISVVQYDSILRTYCTNVDQRVSYCNENINGYLLRKKHSTTSRCKEFGGCFNYYKAIGRIKCIYIGKTCVGVANFNAKRKRDSVYQEVFVDTFCILDLKLNTLQ